MLSRSKREPLIDKADERTLTSNRKDGLRSLGFGLGTLVKIE
jgi:hypothetical protein